MQIFKSLFICCAFYLLGVGTIFAAPANNMQQKELLLLVDTLNKAAAERNVSVFTDNIPERLVHAMAVRMNATEADLRESFAKDVQIQINQNPNFVYILDGQHIIFSETKDGTIYALIPTHTETKNGVSDSTTLALYDNSKWHVIFGGLEVVKHPVFLEIYPSFRNVNFDKTPTTKNRSSDTKIN